MSYDGESIASRSSASSNTNPVRRYQVITLVTACYLNFVSNMGFTILASFFDENAAAHGVSKTHVGLIVAIYAGVAAVTCPVFGAFLPVFGRKFTLVAGLVVGGTCAGLFSLLDIITSPTVYLVIGLILRAVQAVGTSAYFTAAYAIMVSEWSGKRLPSALGIYEAFTGLGMIVGPITGSALYSAGGYELPFYVVAGLLLSASIFSIYALEPDNYTVATESVKDEEVQFRSVVRPLLTNGYFIIPNILLLPVWSCMDFIMPFVGPYLSDCGATEDKILVGAIFLAAAFAYTFSCFLWGYLCSNYNCQRSIMIWGAIVAASSYIFLGPSPWLSGIKGMELRGEDLGFRGSPVSLAPHKSALDEI